MARQLTANVAIRDPSTGNLTFLPIGSDLPAWAAGLVGDHALTSADPDPGPIEQPGDMPDLEELDPTGPPPRHGAGSSTSAWLVYAHTNDVTVPDGASRTDIIAACAAAGVPTD